MSEIEDLQAQVAALSSRLADVDDFINSHSQLGASLGPNFPHPDLRVRSLLFGDGAEENKIDKDGILFVSAGAYGDVVEWKVGSSYIGSIFADASYIYLQANANAARATLTSNQYAVLRLGYQDIKLQFGNDHYLLLTTSGIQLGGSNGEGLDTTSGDLVLTPPTSGSVIIDGETFSVAEKVILKTADESVNNSTTMQNDDHFTLSVGANEQYSFRILLTLQAANTTSAGFKFGWSLPSGSNYAWHSLVEVTTFGVDNQDGQLTYNPGDINIHTLELRGGFVTTNPGTAVLQWAQNTAHASDSIIYAGSEMRYLKQA